MNPLCFCLILVTQKNLVFLRSKDASAALDVSKNDFLTRLVFAELVGFHLL